METEKLAKALARAVKNITKDPAMVATAHSAGYIFATKQRRGKRHGLQVFVKVCRYSDELLASNPESGGLATVV